MLNYSNMEKDSQNVVSQLLSEWSEGDEQALGQLMPLVEQELREMAGRYMRREARNHTLQPTAVVNELYLKLHCLRRVSWKNRPQFFGFAAQTMRRILVDHARIRRAGKRGDGARPMSLEDVFEVPSRENHDLVDLDDALKGLAEVDVRQSRIVELRFFAGLTSEEIGEVLGISPRTVRREWRTARLWLHQEVGRR